ncbi:hypothetical protein [Paenibacillus sp. Y412MC10]|uniref:hypothetical protein n=1 Tax=Geobacillus sp. (strain Y412MC10) TaxID=481743 RepID=UPI0011AB4CAD|nr:hypothetical protein [Paenibacillus sp. Y412MC10]
MKKEEQVLNQIISEYSFDQLKGNVDVRHVENSKGFFDSDTLDIVLTVNDLGYGNTTSELIKMLNRLPQDEGIYPFSFYTVVGFLREETHSMYQAFTSIHIVDSLQLLITSFITDLKNATSRPIHFEPLLAYESLS